MLRGNPGHQRLNRNEPQPESALECPEPPDNLTGDARSMWLRFAPELHRLRLLTIIDTTAFEIYCQAVGRWRIAERQLAQVGAFVVDGSTKNQVVSAHFKAAVEAARDVVRFGSEFGLSPAARVRLTASGYKEPEPRDNKFSGLLA